MSLDGPWMSIVTWASMDTLTEGCTLCVYVPGWSMEVHSYLDIHGLLSIQLFGWHGIIHGTTGQSCLLAVWSRNHFHGNPTTAMGGSWMRPSLPVDWLARYGRSGSTRNLWSWPSPIHVILNSPYYVSNLCMEDNLSLMLGPLYLKSIKWWYCDDTAIVFPADPLHPN